MISNYSKTENHKSLLLKQVSSYSILTNTRGMKKKREGTRDYLSQWFSWWNQNVIQANDYPSKQEKFRYQYDTHSVISPSLGWRAGSSPPKSPPRATNCYSPTHSGSPALVSRPDSRQAAAVGCWAPAFRHLDGTLHDLQMQSLGTCIEEEHTASARDAHCFRSSSANSAHFWATTAFLALKSKPKEGKERTFIIP